MAAAQQRLSTEFAVAPEPRLSTGVFVSILLHGAVIAAFIVLRSGSSAPLPPMYKVQLIAAPAGERAIGVVQNEPQPTPPKPAPTPPVAPVTKSVPPTVKAPPKTKAPPKAAPAPVVATPTPPTKAAPPPTAAPAAGGGPTGGKGADVANVDTPGIDFPYPWYTQNITRRLILAFGQPKIALTAEVRFIIRRDGTVDPESIRMVTPSRDYSFNQQALGAVEAVANAKLFGPLPPGFQEDILPVTFRFSPNLTR
ncbi:MAG: energy transducer TonB [bacterium]